MPAKRRLAKAKEHRITDEAVAAFQRMEAATTDGEWSDAHSILHRGSARSHGSGRASSIRTPNARTRKAARPHGGGKLIETRALSDLSFTMRS